MNDDDDDTRHCTADRLAPQLPMSTRAAAAAADVMTSQQQPALLPAAIATTLDTTDASQLHHLGVASRDDLVLAGDARDVIIDSSVRNVATSDMVTDQLACELSPVLRPITNSPEHDAHKHDVVTTETVSAGLSVLQQIPGDSDHDTLNAAAAQSSDRTADGVVTADDDAVPVSPQCPNAATQSATSDDDAAPVSPECPNTVTQSATSDDEQQHFMRLVRHLEELWSQEEQVSNSSTATARGHVAAAAAAEVSQTEAPVLSDSAAALQNETADSAQNDVTVYTAPQNPTADATPPDANVDIASATSHEPLMQTVNASQHASSAPDPTTADTRTVSETVGCHLSHSTPPPLVPPGGAAAVVNNSVNSNDAGSAELDASAASLSLSGVALDDDFATQSDLDSMLVDDGDDADDVIRQLNEQPYVQYKGPRGREMHMFSADELTPCQLMLLRLLDPANYVTDRTDRQIHVTSVTDCGVAKSSALMLDSLKTILTSGNSVYSCPYLSGKLHSSSDVRGPCNCSDVNRYHYTELVWHVLRVHQRDFGHNFDDKESSPSGMPVVVAHKHSQFVCDTCLFTTRHAVMFLEHLRHHATSASPPYFCSACDVYCDANAALRHFQVSVVFGLAALSELQLPCTCMPNVTILF